MIHLGSICSISGGAGTEPGPETTARRGNALFLFLHRDVLSTLRIQNSEFLYSVDLNPIVSLLITAGPFGVVHELTDPHLRNERNPSTQICAQLPPDCRYSSKAVFVRLLHKCQCHVWNPIGGKMEILYNKIIYD